MGLPKIETEVQVGRGKIPRWFELPYVTVCELGRIHNSASALGRIGTQGGQYTRTLSCDQYGARTVLRTEPR